VALHRNLDWRDKSSKAQCQVWATEQTEFDPLSAATTPEAGGRRGGLLKGGTKGARAARSAAVFLPERGSSVSRNRSSTPRLSRRGINPRARAMLSLHAGRIPTE
jgi:hypothetical protein